MGLDFDYRDGDNTVISGNYAQITGISAKVARALRMRQTRVDGVLVGNPGWDRLVGEGITRTTMAIWKRACQETLRFFEDLQQMTDLEIQVEEGNSGSVRTWIRYHDMVVDEDTEMLIPASWEA